MHTGMKMYEIGLHKCSALEKEKNFAHCLENVAYLAHN